MGDGKALQAATSHNLGQHFATAYGIDFLDRDQQRAQALVHVVGLVHAHDRWPDHDPRRRHGLVLPPSVAPYQVVIVPIPPRKGDWNEQVLPKAREVMAALKGAGIRVHLDDRDNQQPGFKYADWEMRGVPLRLELGPKDIEKDQCVLVRRDTREKTFVPLAGLAQAARDLLDRMQVRPARAGPRPSWRTTPRASPPTPSSRRPWPPSAASSWPAGTAIPAIEARIKEETKATVRVIPLDARRGRWPAS